MLNVVRNHLPNESLMQYWAKDTLLCAKAKKGGQNRTSILTNRPRHSRSTNEVSIQPLLMHYFTKATVVKAAQQLSKTCPAWDYSNKQVWLLEAPRDFTLQVNTTRTALLWGNSSATLQPKCKGLAELPKSYRSGASLRTTNNRRAAGNRPVIRRIRIRTLLV